MSSFTSELVVSPTQDGKHWQLKKKFTYHIGSKYSQQWIKVKAGFATDFASIPKIIFWLFPWSAKFNKAAILHDWLYKVKVIMGKPITRKDADDVFLEAMLIDFRNHKSGEFVAFVEYRGVRLFSWMAWH